MHKHSHKIVKLVAVFVQINFIQLLQIIVLFQIFNTKYTYYNKLYLFKNILGCVLFCLDLI